MGNTLGKRLKETMPFKERALEIILIHSEITTTHYLASDAKTWQPHSKLISD